MLMKKMRTLVIALIVTLVSTFNCYAMDYIYQVPKLTRVTCYHASSGVTASGTVPMMGRTVGAKREWIGSACLIYRCNPDGSIGELIGIFVVEDSGSAKRVKEGAIDVYRETYQQCKDWIAEYGDYCFVQVISGCKG